MDDNGGSRKRLGLSGLSERRKLGGRLADYAETRREGNLLLGDIKAHMLKKASMPNNRRTDIIHPSEMAKSDWCPRDTYYRMSGLTKKDTSKFNFVLENIFDEGHLIHHKWQSRIEEMGRLWGDWICKNCGERTTGTSMFYCECEFPYLKYAEVPLWYLCQGKELICGHADGAIEDLSSLIEIKSIGIGTLRYDAPKILEAHTYDGVLDLEGVWKGLRRPLAPHIRQGNIYLWLAKQMLNAGDMLDEFTKMIFLYEFKANQQVKEFVITLSDDIMAPLLDKAEQIRYGIDNGAAPKCPFGGCEACLAYGQDKKAIIGPDAKDERSVDSGEAKVRKRRTGNSAEAKGRSAGVTRGHNRSRRPQADVADDTVDGVGELPIRSSGGGSGRRAVRRYHTKEETGIQHDSE